MNVSVLYARRDSFYKVIGVDVWDADRDARRFDGEFPVVAHPPSRAWGKLAHFAKPLPGEKDMARHAVSVVRRNGGVLEHPAHSRLWDDMSLPRPGQTPDEFGGYSVEIMQGSFGHRADKRTWLYLVRCEFPLLIPSAPNPQRSVEMMGRAERERTPPELARLLVAVASQATQRKE